MSLASDKLRALLGPRLVTLCVVPLLLWAGSAPIGPRFEGRYAVLTSVAVLLALAGTSALALNLVLGARLRPVEALFGGLEQMYKPSGVAADPKLFASLAAVAFAGPALAVAVLSGSYLIARGR